MVIGLLPLVDLSVNEGRGDNSSGSFCWVAYVSVASVGLLFALDELLRLRRVVEHVVGRHQIEGPRGACVEINQ